MVSHDDPVPGPEVGDTGADLDDLARDLMAQDDGSPGSAIPFEDVRTTDAAGSHANEDFTGPDLRDGPLFQTDVPIAVVNGDVHGRDAGQMK